MDKDKLILQEDKDTIWIPVAAEMNIRNTDMLKRANHEEIFKVVPNHDFEFQHNSKTNYQNGLIFEELTIYTLKLL